MLLLEFQCVLLVLLSSPLMLLWHVSWHQNTLQNWIHVSNSCSGSLSWIEQYFLLNFFHVESRWKVYIYITFLCVCLMHKKKILASVRASQEGKGTRQHMAGGAWPSDFEWPRLYPTLLKLSTQCNYSLFVTLWLGSSVDLVLMSAGQCFLKFNVHKSTGHVIKD